MKANTERNFSGDFCSKPTSQGSGETVTCCPKNDYLSNFIIEDFEHTQKSNTFIDVVFDSEINKNWKPPSRILERRPSRTPQQIAEDLQRKLQESSDRRQSHINNIVERSRRQNEKVANVREKLASRRAENALAIQKEVDERKEAAEKIREKLINEKVEKFRKQVQHANEVKSKKLASIAR